MDFDRGSSFNEKEFPYAVVEYTSFEDSLVEAVPSTWLYDGAYRLVDDKKVLFAKSYWPLQVSKVETFIRNNRNPGGAFGIVDKDLWSKEHSVRVLKFCKSYQVACLKRNKAQFKDHLDTTDAEKGGRSQRNRRRRISESDSIDPPKVKTLKLQKAEPENLPPSSNFDELSFIAENECPVSHSDKSSSPRSAMTIEENNIKSPEKRKVSSTPTRKSPRRSLFSPRQSFNSTPGLLPVMREIAHLKSTLNKVVLILNKVWTAVAPPIEGPASSHFPRLPIDSKEDMKKWNEFLSDDRNFYTAVNVLSSHGRPDHRESLYAIMRALLTDKLAAGFNMDGRKKKDDPSPKEAFGETLSYKLLKVAMKKHINHFNKGIDPQKVSLVYNVKNIKEDTMRWLKDAKIRASNKEKRENAAIKAKTTEEATAEFEDLFDDDSN